MASSNLFSMALNNAVNPNWYDKKRQQANNDDNATDDIENSVVEAKESRRNKQ